METPDQSLEFNRLMRDIIATYEGDSGTNFIDVKNLPVRDKVVGVIELLMELLFPGYTGRRRVTRDNVASMVLELLVVLRRELAEQIELALRHHCRMKDCPALDCSHLASQRVAQLLERIPAVRQLLKEDVQAAYDGDPAAKSFEEIVISYPCLMAISIHRIAHELNHLEVPMIPRMMSEYAHSKTGIDIHPGAHIGRSFFIDHGTGVVIGETAIIGSNVKIYQGVTLGALSFPRDENGQIIRDRKRHPTLEDDVTVYAEATILGDIVIGAGSVIGGNVWIRDSVPPGTIVLNAKPDLVYRKKDKE